jgi:protein TonB
MREMFRDVVTHRAKRRNSIVAPFASIPALIAAVFACWSLFNFALPMPVVEAINFVQVDVRPPTLPSAPAQRADSVKAATTTSPSVTPIAAPEGIKLEAPRIVEVADNVSIGEIPGSESLPALLPSVTADSKPVPPPPTGEPAQKPIMVGGLVKAPTRINNIAVVYPAIARAAQVQGVVIVEATISAAGKVIDAKILRSIPLLDEAALDAVKQWEFTTPTLNGQPVPVIMTVTVNFTLR